MGTTGASRVCYLREASISKVPKVALEKLLGRLPGEKSSPACQISLVASVPGRGECDCREALSGNPSLLRPFGACSGVRGALLDAAGDLLALPCPPRSRVSMRSEDRASRRGEGKPGPVYLSPLSPPRAAEAQKNRSRMPQELRGRGKLTLDPAEKRPLARPGAAAGGGTRSSSSAASPAAAPRPRGVGGVKPTWCRT